MSRSAALGLTLPLAAAVARVGALPGWWLPELAVLAVGLRCWYWQRGGGRWGDYLGGVAFHALAFSFLVAVTPQWSWLPPLAVGMILGLWALAERMFFFGLRRFLPPSLSAALALVVVDGLRFAVPMGGVPWAGLGLGFADRPLSLHWGSVLGEVGTGLWVALWGAFLVALFHRRSRWEWMPAPLLTLIAVVGAAEPAPVGGSIRTVAVQGNLSLEQKHGSEGERPRYGMRRVFEMQARPTAEALRSVDDVALILWAETMFPYPVMPPDEDGWLRRPWPDRPDEEVDARVVGRIWQNAVGSVLDAAPPGCRFITGAHYYEPVPTKIGPEYSRRSSEFLAFGLHPDRSVEIVDHFTKQHLVPFGERLPLRGQFPGADSVAMAIFRASRLYPRFAMSERRGPLQLGSVLLGGAVCWENVYEQPFRLQAEEGAQAFVVLSNEAWYGISAEMEQMVAATRWRAVETGRAILRATNTGVTVLIDGAGRAVRTLPPGVTGFLAVDLPLVDGQVRTPYLGWGWTLCRILLWMAGLLGLLGWLWPERKPAPVAIDPDQAPLDPSPGQE